jgi:hypothetical protein
MFPWMDCNFVGCTMFSISWIFCRGR